jgi:hypothetical protein
LAVEIDVEQLAGVQRLADAVHEVQPGHLLVPGLGRRRPARDGQASR